MFAIPILNAQEKKPKTSYNREEQIFGILQLFSALFQTNIYLIQELS